MTKNETKMPPNIISDRASDSELVFYLIASRIPPGPGRGVIGNMWAVCRSQCILRPGASGGAFWALLRASLLGPFGGLLERLSPKKPPRIARHVPKTPPGRAQEAPDGRQEAPKRAQCTPKRAPKGSQKSSKTTLEVKKRKPQNRRPCRRKNKIFKIKGIKKHQKSIQKEIKSDKKNR